MALSVRIFGLSSWSILVPQALMGVGSVGLLYATVKRWSGPVAGLVAGAVLALTPVAVLMFRFNNPDALLYLVAAPATVRRRIGHLLAAGLALLVSAGWWVAIVELVPASARPYIGGSQTNSVWELIWGYNGLGRLTGDETGSVGGGGGWGETGLLRLVDAEIGGQIAWLLPAAPA